jgi:hypothetical protein
MKAEMYQINLAPSPVTKVLLAYWHGLHALATGWAFLLKGKSNGN